MPYRSMSLEEFAQHVGMDVREVRRLADRGKLPGQKVGSQWRFNRAQVTEWLQQEMHTLDEARLIAIEQAMSGTTADTVRDKSMVVTDLIGLDGIDIAFAAKTKASVLRELVRLAGCTGLLYDADGLLEALQQREALCSTALPNGVAIPHPRQPMPYVSAEPLICVARAASGIAFGAPKGELTRLFFLICCHADRYHLHVLARLMRILDDQTVSQVMAAGSGEELLELLMSKEKEVLAKLR
jgi:PTS system nitrogen regulatory IIA component